MRKLLLLSAILCYTMMANAIEVNNNASEMITKKGGDFHVDGIAYEVLTENTVRVVANESDFYSGSIIIPEEVTYMDYETMQNRTYTVTEIGAAAFSPRGLTSITSITLPNTIETIGDEAFCRCSITSVTIPSSVTTIGQDAFYQCDGLTSVTLNSDAIVSADYDDNNGFSEIFGTQVEEYIMGPAITSIGEAAFFKCINLTAVTIPASVVSVGMLAFGGCQNMTSITFADGSRLAAIGVYAFSDCEKLTGITIPATVTSVGNNAFDGCSGLSSVEFEGSDCQNAIGENVFLHVGTQEAPATLILPMGWKYAHMPADNPSQWYGGYFSSDHNQKMSIEEYRKSILEWIAAEKAKVTGYSDEEENFLAECVNDIEAATTMEDIDKAGEDAWKRILLRKDKNAAIPEIETARDATTGWTDEELSTIQLFLDNIESSTTDISTLLTAALNFMAHHENRETAINDIIAAMGDYADSDYLKSLVVDEIAEIYLTTDDAERTAHKEAAIAILTKALPAYAAGRTEALGPMGKQQKSNHAVKVMKDDNVVILYDPDKVEFIQVSDNGQK